MYPLNPEKTTVMKTNYNAFIFPNDKALNEQDNDKFVGVMLNETVNAEIRNVFEDVLNNFAILLQQNQNQQAAHSQSQQVEVPKNKKVKEQQVIEDKKEVIIVDDDDDGDAISTAEYISKNLVNGAKFINRSVAATTEYANKYLNIGGEKLKSQIKSNETPSKVDPTVQKCAEGARYGSHLTVRVSSFLVDKLGTLATKTAKTVAPYIKSGSTKLLTQTGVVKSSDTANQYLENVCTVASGTAVGFSIVYKSLGSAAKALAKSVAEQSVQVVKHKYGDDASKVTENMLYSAGNVALSANNIKNLKITKTIAKAAVKETVNSFAKKDEEKNKNAK